MVKKGFSLVEALIVMLVLSIFFAFGARTITIQQKPRREHNTHGYYECYKTETGWNQRYVINGIDEDETILESGICNFERRPNINMFWLQARVGGIDGNYYTIAEPNVNDNFSISFENNLLEVINNDITSIIQPVDNYGDTQFSNYLLSTYRNSNIYNNGNIRDGVIISW